MTLRDRFRSSAPLKQRRRAGGYEEWLEGEIVWYRDWADKLAAEYLSLIEDVNERHALWDFANDVQLLNRYRDERNDRDFD